MAARSVAAVAAMFSSTGWLDWVMRLAVVSGAAVPTAQQWAASEEGDRAVLDGAKAMAMTVMDLWLTEGLAGEVRAAFGSGP